MAAVAVRRDPGGMAGDDADDHVGEVGQELYADELAFFAFLDRKCDDLSVLGAYVKAPEAVNKAVELWHASRAHRSGYLG